jgi:hypothetical protein
VGKVRERKRRVKPTGWVVDMRHYIDEDTGDLPDVIPERVLSLAIFFGAIVAWVTDHCLRAASIRMCLAGAVPTVVGAAATSSRNSTARLDTSSGSAHSAATTA